MADGPRVTIDIAEKRFAMLPVPLFRGLQLTVAPSSVLALVGPSGVGKSSLLRMIAGIDSDFSGSIMIDGVAAAEAPPAGFVFQDSRLLPWLSALDNIRVVREGSSEAEALDLLARVGLSGYGDAYPHQMSGGMQRRVALARALSVNSRLLLLDEPFVSLDRSLVADVQRVFLEVMAQAASTAILVTHLAEDAARLADRAIVLKGMPAQIVGDVDLGGSPATRSLADVQRLTQMIATFEPMGAL